MKERHDTLTVLREHDMQKLDLRQASFHQSQIGGQKSYSSRMPIAHLATVRDNRGEMGTARLTG